MIYKFKILIKKENKGKHLSPKDKPNAFKTGKLDPNNLRYSDLPNILKELDDESVKKLENGEKVYFTQTTTETIEVIKEYGR